MCLRAHYIDNDYNLWKEIINFRLNPMDKSNFSYIYTFIMLILLEHEVVFGDTIYTILLSRIQLLCNFCKLFVNAEKNHKQESQP